MKITHSLITSALLTGSTLTHAGISNSFTTETAWATAVGAGNFTTEIFTATSGFDLINVDEVRDVGEFNVYYYNNNVSLNLPQGSIHSKVVNVGGTAVPGSGFVDDFLQLEYATSGTYVTTDMQLQFDAPITAFSANFGSINDSAGLTFTMDGQAVDIYSAMQASANPLRLNTEGFAYLGWTFDNPISSISITASSTDIFSLDNASISSSVAPVPVPAAVWLMGSALFGLAGFRKKNAHK